MALLFCRCITAHPMCCLQVIAVICVLVWVMNINRFNDPALGGWVSGEWCDPLGGLGGLLCDGHLLRWCWA